MSDSLLTIEEAADILKVHWQTIRRYIKEGKLKSYKVGRNVRIKSSDLETLLYSKKNTDRAVEYELRYVIRNRKLIEQRLLDLEAKVTSHNHIIDHWYIANNIKSEEEKDRFYESVNGYGLRVRETDNDYSGKVITTMEIKKLASPPDHSVCIEHEFEVENLAAAEEFLRLINHKEFMVIDKDRIVYRKGEIVVVIDDILGYGIGIEIEIKTSESKKTVMQKINAFAKGLGIKDSDKIDKSMTYYAMKKLAKY